MELCIDCYQRSAQWMRECLNREAYQQFLSKYMTMRTYTVFLLCLTVFFLFADQNLLAPNLSMIADEFNMDDHERDQKLGGDIALGFFVIGAPAALLVGYYTDIVNRCRLFGIVVVLGATASFSTYFVSTYTELFVCRIFTGISIGGINPVIFSLLGDLYPGESRIHVSTVIGISQSAGIAIGQLIAGMIGPDYGWRLPFLIVSIPSILLAFLFYFTVEEPKRGAQEKAVLMYKSEKKAAATDLLYYHKKANNRKSEDEAGTVSSTPQDSSPQNNEDKKEIIKDEGPREEAEDVPTKQSNYSHSTESNNSDISYSEKIEWDKIKQLFRTPSAVLIFLQGFPGCIPWGMIYVFLNDYFSEDRGMSVQAATAALTCFFVGGLFGQLFGGWFGQILYNKDPRYQDILMGSTTLLAILPMVYLLNTPDAGGGFFYFVAIVGGFVVSINGPNVRVVIQNVCKPEVRGTAFAVFTLADDIGKGLGPAMVVLFIEDYNGDRRKAFNVIVMFWIFCGCVLLLLYFTVIEDEHAVQKGIKEDLLRRNAIDEESLQPQINPIIASSDYIYVEPQKEPVNYHPPSPSISNEHPIEMNHSDI